MKAPLSRILTAVTFCLALMFLAVNPPSPSEASSRSTKDAFMPIAFELISRWEGKRNHAYLDIVGVPTICYGSIRGIKLGMYKTDAECKALLEHEIDEFRWELRPYFSKETVAARLPATREAAYVSLAFNVGWGGAGKSTAMRRLNAGNIVGGCHAISWWNKAGGRVVRGLVRRRAEEVSLCLQGT